MSFDYSLLYKSVISGPGPIKGPWDTFVSGYNLSERVQDVFASVTAKRKIWVIHSEYGLGSAERPSGESILFDGVDEAEDCQRLLNRIVDDTNSSGRLCIDITGMMRPHMMCLIARLEELGAKRVDVLYSEPITYTHKEKTEFSRGSLEVRQVYGMEGLANFRSSDDLMVIGAGYDDRQIAEVAQHVDPARKVVIFGFPPLRADMYQQNLLRVNRAWSELGELPRTQQYFAPANDPFVTANVLKSIVDTRRTITNLYLAPLSTKAQALGFVLYYIAERRGTHSSMIYPFSERYDSRTTKGVTRTWKYVVEFPRPNDSSA